MLSWPAIFLCLLLQYKFTRTVHPNLIHYIFLDFCSLFVEILDICFNECDLENNCLVSSFLYQQQIRNKKSSIVLHLKKKKSRMLETCQYFHI